MPDERVLAVLGCLVVREQIFGQLLPGPEAGEDDLDLP